MKKILLVIATVLLGIFGLSNLMLLGGKDMPKADLVLFNAKLPGVEASKSIIIKDGRVLTIVSNQESYGHIDDKTKTLDAKNLVATAGFKDSHLHLGAMGKFYKYQNLGKVKFIDRVTPLNDWVIIVGLTNELQKTFKDNTLLNKHYPNTYACIIHESFHMMICNNKALKLAGITAKNGKTDEHQFKKMLSHFPIDTVKSVKVDILKAQEILIKQGIFEIDNMDVSQLELSALNELTKENLLNIKVNNFVSKSIAKKVRMNFKLFLDGALGPETAAMNDGYTSGFNAEVLLSKEEMLDWFNFAFDNKLEIAIHAIGDKAYDYLCDTYSEFGKKIIIRVEHAQHIKKIRNKDFIYSVQPLHYYTDTAWIKDKLSNAQIINSYRWKSIIDSGATLLSGSDAPIAMPEIKKTIEIMSTGKNIKGDIFNQLEVISIEQAIKANSSELKIGSNKVFLGFQQIL